MIGRTLRAGPPPGLYDRAVAAASGAAYDTAMDSGEWVTLGLDRRFGVERLRAHFTAHCYERHAHETYAIGLTEEGSQSFHCRGGQAPHAAGVGHHLQPDRDP